MRASEGGEVEGVRRVRRVSEDELEGEAVSKERGKHEQVGVPTFARVLT